MKRIIFILFVLMLFAAMTVTTTSVQAERGIQISYKGGEPEAWEKRQIHYMLTAFSNEMADRGKGSILKADFTFQPEENKEEVVHMYVTMDPPRHSFEATSRHEEWHNEITQKQNPFIKAIVNGKYKKYTETD